VQEKLLVSHQADGVDIALYLDAELLERLAGRDPRERLDHGNFADFCTVLEGVSHFNYVAWRAAADRCVTLLELEMQAEVDKYVSARALLSGQAETSSAVDVYRRLFGELRFHEDLSDEELERYRDASLFARRYCHSLESRFEAGPPKAAMIRELRSFYRMPQPAKVSHIHARSFG